MSNRMAAKFGGGAPATTTPTSSEQPQQHPPPKGKAREAKRFCTRGEEFFEFLKALGYPPSKHQQFEYFEYLFQDEVASSFVRKLMANLKTQHCVLPDEIERYETLEKQGLVIYGSDLEEAVTRRRTINEMYSQQKFKRQAKKEELEKDLEAQEKELKRLGELEMAFSKQLLDWEGKHKQASHMSEIIQQLIKEDEREIEIDLSLLNKKMEELEASVAQLKKDLSVYRPQRNAANYICQIDGRRLLENEERLFEMIQDMIRKHGTSLIMKDAGYGIEGDLMSVENIKKVFAQFEKDFDRLKHCLIYEKVNQLCTEIALAGEQEVHDNFDEYCTRTVQLSEFDCETRLKLQKDTRDAFNNANIAFEKENDELLDHARQITLFAVDKIFSTLTDIRTRSKKKLQEFFIVVTNALKAQKVRLSLITNLAKAEAQLYGRLLSNIEENLAVSSRHSKKLLITKSAEASDLTLYGQILRSLFVHLGVNNPLEVAISVPKTLITVRKASSEIGKLYWTTILEKQSQFHDQYKHLKKIQEVQSKMQQSSDDNASKGGRTDTRTKGAEEHIKKLERQLKAMQQNCVSTTKELENQREENKQKCKELLQSFEVKKS